MFNHPQKVRIRERGGNGNCGYLVISAVTGLAVLDLRKMVKESYESRCPCNSKQEHKLCKEGREMKRFMEYEADPKKKKKEISTVGNFVDREWTTAEMDTDDVMRVTEKARINLILVSDYELWREDRIQTPTRFGYGDKKAWKVMIGHPGHWREAVPEEKDISPKAGEMTLKARIDDPSLKKMIMNRIEELRKAGEKAAPVAQPTKRRRTLSESGGNRTGTPGPGAFSQRK